MKSMENWKLLVNSMMCLLALVVDIFMVVFDPFKKTRFLDLRVMEISLFVAALDVLICFRLCYPLKSMFVRPRCH